MHVDRSIAESRFANVYYRHVLGALVESRQRFVAEAWEVPGDGAGQPGEPVPVETALAATYTPIAVGAPWGPPWATTWFRLTAVIPEAMSGRPVDVVIDLGFDANEAGFQAEAMVWRQHVDGDWRPFRGIHPRNNSFRLTDSAVAGERVDVLVEAASNPSITDGFPDPNSDILTSPRTPRYVLRTFDLRVVAQDVWELHEDIHICRGLLTVLGEHDPRRAEIFMALERCVDALDLTDVVGTAADARSQLAPVMSRPAVPSAHRISAIGHAHIDSAWLWPLRETVRKCARSFSNVLRLMEDEPEFKFACSQAAQYEWMANTYPTIFADIQTKAEGGQWVPVGGSWVEADGNLPSGESHLRQLVHGQRFFREHFGTQCREIWIPDVFGYPASLPQIFRLGGADRFLTQKLSWNRTNRIPHNTFLWEGIDGTRVYTHFPPVDTYNAMMDVGELTHSVENFADHGATDRSLMPFGYGDGGGGPSPDMMRRFHQVRDLEGLPRVEIESPETFFDAAQAEYPDPPVWFGELYFEMHRGTYTSQARTKVGNRLSELALREAELWSTMAFGAAPENGYPLAVLDRQWKTVLLHQFHDILPGSSIGWVHREAEATYAEVLETLGGLIDAALVRLTSGSLAATLANPAPHDRDEVIVVPNVVGSPTGSGVQALADGSVAYRAQVPAMTLTPAVAVAVDSPVTVKSVGATTVLANNRMTVAIDSDGCVTSLVHHATGRESIAPGERGSRWQIHPDYPIEYDAWDLEEYYRRRVTNLDAVSSIEVVDAGPIVARVRVTRSFGSAGSSTGVSTLIETFELRADAVRLDVHIDLDWQERKQILKVAWPLDVHTDDVIRHIQYGHIRTPIHTNTSWDTARFELCAHQWIDVGEPGFGVAMLNNGRYGHDVTRTRTDAGETSTTMRLTVVKGAEFPDPLADLGRHQFTYAVMPHAGRLRRLGVIEEGYRINMAVRAVPASPVVGSTSSVVPPVVTCSDDRVIIEAVKAAEDGSGDVIVRCYESHGGRASGILTFGRPMDSIELTNALEDEPAPEPAPALTNVSATTVTISLRPFQIATVRCQPAPPG